MNNTDLSGLEPLICKESLQRACGIYLAALEALKAHVPEEFFSKELPELRQASLGRHMWCASQTSSNVMCLFHVCFKFQRTLFLRSRSGFSPSTWTQTCWLWLKGQFPQSSWMLSATFEPAFSDTRERPKLLLFFPA